MDNPGFYSLGSFQITTAGTQIGDWTEADLDGLLAMAAQLRLAYGSGGTTVRAYLQTTLDQGTTAIDIWCCLFGTAAESAAMNFCATDTDLDQVTATDGTLSDDTSIAGILGDKFRVKIVSTGTYGNSTVLTAGMVAR